MSNAAAAPSVGLAAPLPSVGHDFPFDIHLRGPYQSSLHQYFPPAFVGEIGPEVDIP